MRQIFRRIPLACLSVLLLSLSPPSPAQAQYFGRNKVQYKDFKFEVLKTDHFDIYFYEEERENAARVGRMAERWYARLSSIFEHEMRTRQPLVLYASHPDFEQTNVVGGMIGEGTGGVTEGSEAPRRAAARRHARRNRPCARPRARACIPIRHLGAARAGGGRAAASKRCRSGSSKGWPSTCRLARSIRTRPCGCAMRPARKSCRRSEISTTANSSPIGGDRPSGRISAASTATISSARSSGPRCARAIRSRRSKQTALDQRQGALDQLARRHPRAVRARDGRDRSRAHLRPVAHRQRQDAHGDQRVAVDQPRRAAHRLFLVARSVLDRSVSRGDARRDASCESSSTRR